MPVQESRQAIIRAVTWLLEEFGSQLQQAAFGPFTTDIFCGMACKETMYFWLPQVGRLSAEEIVARCVLDGSGDAPNSSRTAFPRNTAAFRQVFGDELTEMLISEANATRALRGLGPQQWVYKGYGIFQYDLQFVRGDDGDPEFFRQRRWYSFANSLAKAVGELRNKFAIHRDLWRSVKAYNGSGPRATEYANDVMEYAAFAREVLGSPQDEISSLDDAVASPAVIAAVEGPFDRMAFRELFTGLGLRHFSPDEFLVKGGSHGNPDSAAFGLNTDPPRSLWENILPTARVLDELRARIGSPLTLSSVYRSPAYNRVIAGASQSQHMEFKACDFVAHGRGSPADWASMLRAMRQEGLFRGGIGIYPSFVHVDTRGSNADWQG